MQMNGVENGKKRFFLVISTNVKLFPVLSLCGLSEIFYSIQFGELNCVKVVILNNKLQVQQEYHINHVKSFSTSSITDK